MFGRSASSDAPPLPGRSRAVRRSAIALGAGLLLAALAPMSAAWAATGTVNTNGTPLNVRASASTSATVVGTLADGASISIDCQTYGSTVTGTYGTSDIWDHVPAKGGYV